MVVTCRAQEYRDAVRPEGGVEVTLRAAAAVQLRPLDADAVRDYLRDDAGGPVAKARWDSVLAVLGTEAPAGQALSTPLMVGLARAIYNPRPGELAGTLRDPAELCNPDLTDRAAVESLLFDAFIPAAYRLPDGPWKAQDAERWLIFLARHLEDKIGSPDLAWWELPLAVYGFPLAYGGGGRDPDRRRSRCRGREPVGGRVWGQIRGGGRGGGCVVVGGQAQGQGGAATTPRDPLAST